MDKAKNSLLFALLGLAAFAAALACLMFASTLGGYSFLGAIVATFVTLLCATRASALRRTAVAPAVAPVGAAPAPAHVPAAKRAPAVRHASRDEEEEDDEDEDEEEQVVARSPRAHAQGGQAPQAQDADEDEDEELQAQLAALRAATNFGELPMAPMPAPRQAASSNASVVVIEEPLDPAMAQHFEALRTKAPEPVAPEPVAQEEVHSAGALRQMDELRAEIARLREDARLRHAEGGARSRPAGQAEAPQGQSRAPTLKTGTPAREGAADAFAHTELSGLPGTPPKPPAPAAQSYARTEFTGLDGAPREGSGFARTEYLGPG